METKMIYYKNTKMGFIQSHGYHYIIKNLDVYLEYYSGIWNASEGKTGLYLYGARKRTEVLDWLLANADTIKKLLTQPAYEQYARDLEYYREVNNG